MRKYLAIVLVCLSYMGFAQTNYVVTFKVNTANITVGSNGLYLGGGVIGGANAVQLSDPDGNGVYEGTDTLSGAGGGNFIFLNSPSWSGDWGTKENLAGLSCADANNYNDRILPSFTQDTTLLFCFGSCATDTVCPTLPTNPDVTFSVDMNGVTSSFTNVYVSGTLNSWSGNANQLTDPDGDGVYEGDINLAAGNYEFKFTYDNWVGQESLDPATADSVCTLTTGIYTNRYITIGSSDTTLPTYCWEECTACQSTYTPTACGDLFFSEYAEGSSNNKYIEIYNPTANPVSLSGYTVYASGNGGSWTNSFTSNATIASGDVYMIANSSLSSTVIGNADTTLSYPSIVHFNGDDALILMNGNDTIDVLGVPGVDPGSSWTVGTGSTANHTLVRKATVDMGSTDWTTGAGEWDVYASNTWTYSGAHSSNCVVTPNDVTFQVDMNNVTSSFTNVYVSGTVNNWSGNSNQLTDPDGDGVYTGTLSLMPGSYEYKFTYDNWVGQESLDPTLDSACTLTTGIYTNRYATFGNADTTLPVVCWESCASCPVQTDFAVTFMVNTANITVGSNGLYLGGGVIGGANAVQLSDPDGDGIYVGTDTLNGSNGGNFIFLNSPANAWDWNTKENLTGLSCADPNNYNDRILPTFTQDTTLMFCFGTCSTDTSCTVTTTNPDVTFRVDMSNVSASFTNVYVSGTLNGWSGNSNQLTDPDGDGVYEGDINLAAGNYEFKFTYDNWTGQENLDPATADSVCTLTTGIYTNRYITIGSSDTTLPVYCWEECVSCAPAATGCDELFFSEYSEGSSNHKYFEIYNPTANAVSLSGYTVYLSGNGGSFTNSYSPSGSLASGDVYVISTNQADASILAEADTAMAFPSVAHFNGDDALILVSGTDTIDVIGVPGVDPGSSWTVDTGSTKDHTLIRKSSVSAGQTDWTVGATEWNVHPQNTWSFVGAHTSNCIYTPPAPSFPDVVAINTFNSMDANGVADSIGAMKWVKVIVTSIDFDGNAGYSFYAEDATDGINIWNFADKSGYTMPMMGDSLYIHGEVAQFRGLTELEPDSIYLVNQNNTLPAASVETALDETTESELIQLIGMSVVDPTQWPASGSSANVDITNGTDTMTMRIDSDTDIDGSTAPAGMFDVTGLGSQYDFSSPYDEGYQIFPRMLTDIFEYPTIPTYTISDVTGIDADGIADSVGVLCKVVGTVMGVDLQGSATAIQFTIHDGTDGIGVYSSAPAAQSYTVMEGDQVRLIGSIGQFNGLTQMYPDSIAFISSNNTLPTPTVVTQLGENTESELVTFTSATLVDPSQWTGSGSGFNVDITNGTDTIAMRIDNDVDLYSQAAPTGAFDVTGIGGQYDFSSPHTSGYQLLPRYQADIVPAAAVYVPKIVVSEIMPGSNASSWNADWFEIYNYGDTAVDLAGMSWDDESGISGTSTFPSVTVAPGEAVVVWDDVAANEDSLLVSWKLYPGSVQVISTDELTGSFPSLSQNGDGVYLFDAAGIELTKSEYISGTAGYSIEFDTTGASLGDAVDGVNGAYTSLNGDVGSPGNLTPNTGAGEFTLNGRIYPNPNTGQFNIEMDRTDNYTVEVMDVRGAVLSRMTVEGNTISVDVNVSAGMYLVRVSSARGTVTQRVQVL
ncbi:MAG: lamin tail domain-containing protein [Cryomorphaceae bacterium]